MEHFNRFTAPASDKLRQLQKMVQDIKKNDDSLFNRLKRFQTEQTANILKTGRNTLDRYDQCFTLDTYEDPQGDHDDNYEPPPRLQGHMKAFTVSPSITNPRGEYVDSCRGRPAKPNHPFQMQQRHKPPRPTHRSLTEEEDVITLPQVNRGVKPCVPAHVNAPDFYEVPDMKTHITCFPVLLFSVNKCFFLISRSNSTLQPNTQMAPPKQEPQSEDEYEVCDADDSVNEGPEETTEYILKLPINNCMISVTATSIKTTAVTLPRSPPDTMPSPSATGFHRAKMPLPRQLPSQSRGMLPSDSRSARDAEEEAGVYKKVWYASSCDRKTAEDALLRSAKDSSFLLRKSSGVDAQQPYTLVVFYNSRVYNIPVRYIASTKQYALGKEKQGEERFSSVSDIIENHQKNPLVLVDSQSNTKDYTKLRHAVKPTNITA
uniref:B-cell linker protein-like n=1 Tax=Sinocyclocheilus anshuiensis TaxID=1608454 RepID=A0A671R6Y0_9TELE